MISSCTDFSVPLLDPDRALELVRPAAFAAVDLALIEHPHLHPANFAPTSTGAAIGLECVSSPGDRPAAPCDESDTLSNRS